MTNAVLLHDKDEIEAFLRWNIHLHIYSLGDLDPFFWDSTIWFGLRLDRSLKAVALLYTGLPLPAFLALTEDVSSMRDLFDSIAHLLPRRFYAHLTPGVEDSVARHFHLESHGEHHKMAFKHQSAVEAVDTSGTVRLTVEDLDDIVRLYDASYPGNWFDSRMLGTGQYFGVRDHSRLVAIAGVHVYSPRYQVAALGNIATHPDRRRQGLGKAVTARLCQGLLRNARYIGLNVKSDNQAAIGLYRDLGFEVVCSYGEYVVESK